MSFIINPPMMPGGSGEGGDVSGAIHTINGRQGPVVTLNASDVQAIRNIRNSLAGIEIGSKNQMPEYPVLNSIYIVNDVTPSEVWFFSSNRPRKWVELTKTESTMAVDVVFDPQNVGTDATNVQDALENAMMTTISVKSELERDISLVQRELDRTVANNSNNEGKVKLFASDSLGYVKNKIDSTLDIQNGRLKVVGIDGMVTTIEELDELKGLIESLSSRVDTLSGISGFVGSVETIEDLATIDAQSGDMAVVLQDVNNDNSTSMYMFNGVDWEFIGELKIELRDFSVDKLDLFTESIGRIRENQLPEGVAMLRDIEDVRLESTDDLPEGRVNKYFSEARVEDEVTRQVSNNTNILLNTQQRHTHYNRDVLEKLEIDNDGDLTLDGMKVASAVSGELEWEEF